MSHLTETVAGVPPAKIASPRLPPSENFTGIVLPALATLTTGELSTGEKKPVNGQTIWIDATAELSAYVASVSVIDALTRAKKRDRAIEVNIQRVGADGQRNRAE